MQQSHEDQDAARWSALVRRKSLPDDPFVYAVKTTGIYCRPSCPSRRAKRENLLYFSRSNEAEKAGFRPCLRCRPEAGDPLEQQSELILTACRTIEASDNLPSLDSLAKAAGLSPFHFHRLFKAATGITPRQYAVAKRNDRLRDNVYGTANVTEAIYASGFQTASRFYATTDATLGMTPTDYKNGGSKAPIWFGIGTSTLGFVLAARSEKGVCCILLGDDPDILLQDLQDRFPKATLIGNDPTFDESLAAIIAFVDQPSRALTLPLDIRGTAFQQQVWEALRAIPIGHTASYTEIAIRIGAPKSVRAVAQACAANALAVAIPCHRVVRNDGALSGYRWGVERKQRLLNEEHKERSD
ncbi:bifunctional DNA-binding transcriptional regulator/O6-methylguanine-DNA methyltransferase Ada [Rhizobium sp. CFBP 8762]|uniref:bifunctional DNA-binding transcriptional regulator/O6-methylguanine-DNA methyltransferase Ada n=1 Tax=Rhizobium sp. CFBP 8762 TaxID=2775279 RepID=UPI001782E699|nr:bifunctional DNA-binding transcriptional regulator/O6-methylguanine-DNA methyltransferase Ada [Rhizobium sp. CFBP 8762]MBD8556961.1 bifunctional DNA-binding transcriptional regulator/O6-methylguanine-DNA methyltransferase Ada [Rhizobium sp. CFBP 8762]